MLSTTALCVLHRLSLDLEEIECGGDRSPGDVLLAASLSAQWQRADAIDAAVTNALGGDRQARSSMCCLFTSRKMTHTGEAGMRCFRAQISEGSWQCDQIKWLIASSSAHTQKAHHRTPSIA